MMSPITIGVLLVLLSNAAEPATNAFCPLPDEEYVELSVSGYVTGGGRLEVAWPGGECVLDIFNLSCEAARVPRDTLMHVTISPEMTWSGPDRIFYGVYTVSSNGSCSLHETAVEGPISCRLWSGKGVSLELYAPRCTRATGWTECR